LFEKFSLIFNSREIAAFIWFIILLILFQFSKSIRASIFSVIKAFFKKSIFLIIVLSIAYSSGIIYVLFLNGFWDESLIKDSIFWFVGSAFIVLMNLTKANKEKGFFKKILVDNLKLILVLQFIMNVHVFSLTNELILLPAITFIVIIRTLSEQNEEYVKVKNLMDVILLIAVLTFLTFSIIEIIGDINKFASFKTLKLFLFHIMLSVFFIPCAYAIALYINYEMFYLRLGFFLSNKKDLRYAKWRTFWKCHFRLNKLNSLSPKINELYNESTRDDIKRLII